jgi:hypothetical protein
MKSTPGYSNSSLGFIRFDSLTIASNQPQRLDKLKHCVIAWKDGSNYLTAFDLPDPKPSNNSIKLVRDTKSITLEYSRDKCIDLETDN